MRGIILDELDILNKALDEGVIYKNPLITIRLLAKHYLKKGFDVNNSIDNIVNFMNKNFEGYKDKIWYDSIKSVVKSISKSENYTIKNVKEIFITVNEWNKIITLNDDRLERLAFVLLVYKKLKDEKNDTINLWVNQSLTDIFKEASIRLSNEDKGMMLNKLVNNKYIDTKKSCDGSGIKILYSDNDCENIKIKIDNFTNVISYYYEFRKNEKWKTCEVCSKRFKVKSKTKTPKYCNSCAKKVDNEKAKDRIKKIKVK